jgi:hypothetical protein
MAPERDAVTGVTVAPWVRVKAEAGVAGSTASLKVAVMAVLTATLFARWEGWVEMTVGLVVSAGADPEGPDEDPPPPPQEGRKIPADRMKMSFHLPAMVHLWF